MTQTVSYNGNAPDWTVPEFKDLVDALAAWHDPPSGRLVVRLFWNVEQNKVIVGLTVKDVPASDLDTILSEIRSLLTTAPNDFETGDDRFNWGQ